MRERDISCPRAAVKKSLDAVRDGDAAAAVHRDARPRAREVRGALSASAQRELAGRLEELQFAGVPQLPVARAVRAAVERAWFEQQPLRITYRSGNHERTTRDIRITSVFMDRAETRLNAIDLAKNEARPFRLNRVEKAEVLERPS